MRHRLELPQGHVELTTAAEFLPLFGGSCWRRSDLPHTHWWQGTYHGLGIARPYPAGNDEMRLRCAPYICHWLSLLSGPPYKGEIECAPSRSPC